MKKTYIEPNMKIVAISVKTTILAGSDPQVQTLSIDGASIDDGSKIGSRGGGAFWDDDEE